MGGLNKRLEAQERRQIVAATRAVGLAYDRMSDAGMGRFLWALEQLKASENPLPVYHGDPAAVEKLDAEGRKGVQAWRDAGGVAAIRVHEAACAHLRPGHPLYRLGREAAVLFWLPQDHAARAFPYLKKLREGATSA